MRNLRRAPSRAVILSTAAGLALAIASPASASIATWLSAAGGSAGVGGNWSTGTPPTGADTARFTLNSTYTVTLPGTVPTVGSYLFKAGAVTLNETGAGAHTILSGITLSELAAESSSATLRGQFAMNNAPVRIGQAGAATLALDAGATLTLTDANGDVFVGQGGSGTLLLEETNGATRAALITQSGLAVGDNALGGTGTVRVSGGGVVALSADRTRIQCQSLTVRRGTVEVRDLAYISLDATASLAASLGQSATLTVGSAAPIIIDNVYRSSNFFAQTMRIASNTTAGSPGGNATVRVESSGQAVVAGTTTVGDSDGGFGTLRIEGEGNLFQTGSLVLSPGASQLLLRRGSLSISGGSFSPLPGVFSLDAAGDGYVDLNYFGGSGLFAGGMDIGGSHIAQVYAVGSSNIEWATGPGGLITQRLGANPTGRGDIFISTDSWLTTALNQPVHVGVRGYGRLAAGGGGESNGVVTPGGYILAQGPVIAAQFPGSEGRLDTFGPSGVINVLGSITMGGSPGIPGGQGAISAGSGTLIAATTIYAGADVDILAGGGGRVEAPGGIVALGQITLFIGGEIRGPFSAQGADITGAGFINGVFTGDSGSTIDTDGELTIGSAGPAVAFTMDGTTTIHQGGRLTLGGSNSAAIARVNLDGGELASPALIHLAGGPTGGLIGFGTVSADAVNETSINASGGALLFTGDLTSHNRDILGGTVRFAGGSRFFVRGAVGATITSDPTALMSLVGGDVTCSAGVALNGDLRINGRTAFFTLPGVVRLNGQTSLGLGAIVAPGALVSIGSGGFLTGGGAIVGNVSNAGTIDPDKPTGGLGIVGNFSVDDAAAVFQVDFAADNVFDQLSIQGAASLGGVLELGLVDGYVPSGGAFRATVLTATGGLSGQFAQVNAPALPQGSLSVRYQANSVDVVFCPADFDGNGVLDPDDLADYVGAFFGNPPTPKADYNGDGVTDPDDLADFIGGFFAGC